MATNTEIRRTLYALCQNGQLSQTGLESALTEAHILPNKARWQGFANLCLLVSGSLLVLAGILFFFAFNWQELHRFAKIGLVFGLLTFLAIGAFLKGSESLSGKALLAASSMSIGILLALLGQIYQSGADPYLLFLAWAVLMIPWAISAFLPWLWIFWLVLCNVALWLFLQEIFNVDFFEETRLHWLIFGLNAGALLLWEAFSLRFLWMQKTFAPRLMLVFCAIPAVLMGVIWWWETSHFSPFMYVVWALPTFYFYRFQKRDIFALAIVGFSVMSVLTSGLAKFLFNSNADAASFLVIACAVIGMTSLLARWLKETLRLWQEKAQ